MVKTPALPSAFQDLSLNPKRHLIALCLLVMMAALMIGGMARKSPTLGEKAHLIRGLAFWWAEDMRLNYAHPPLANALAALPVALVYPKVDLSSIRGWEEAKHVHVATHYLQVDYARGKKQIFLARYTIVLLTLLLGVYLYWWCGRLFGWPTAICGC